MNVILNFENGQITMFIAITKLKNKSRKYILSRKEGYPKLLLAYRKY